MARRSGLALTPAEQDLLDRIESGSTELDTPRQHARRGAAAVALMHSLCAREAIPPVRLRWLEDPLLSLGARKSVRQVFESNGCFGDCIYAHPHFLPFLRYFVYGPDLPPEAIDRFCAHISGFTSFCADDLPDLHRITRKDIRRSGLDPHMVAAEYWKLALECRMDDFCARSVRDDIRRMRA